MPSCARSNATSATSYVLLESQLGAFDASSFCPSSPMGALCGQAAKQKSTLTSHTLRHHTAASRDFPCQEPGCYYVARTSPDLRSHQKRCRRSYSYMHHSRAPTAELGALVKLADLLPPTEDPGASTAPAALVVVARAVQL